MKYIETREDGLRIYDFYKKSDSLERYKCICKAFEHTKMEKITQILDLIDGLTILELKDLVKALEEKYGVSAAPVAVAAAPGAAAAPAEEEKTEFDVELTSYDEAAKLKVIKAVKEITGLGLGEAKEIVVGAPKAIKTGVSKEEAEELKKAIEEAGGKVTIK